MSNWLYDKVSDINLSQVEKAKQRQNQLTKPIGALGELENIAIKLAGLLDTEKPHIENIQISTFAADHGVFKHGVSACPQAVTKSMIANFINGGSAVTVMAKALNAKFEVIDCGVIDLGIMTGVIHDRAGNGTNDLSEMDAMTKEQLNITFEAGKSAAIRAKNNNTQLFIGGEMGIGNTTPSSALCAKLLSIDVEKLTDKGVGLDKAGIDNKVKVINKALITHKDKTEPEDILQSLGGFEISALVASYIHCAQLGIPILVGGFIASTAALCAIKINQGCQKWMIFSHLADEIGHKEILKYLKEKPLIDLKMCLGEGSGAAITAPLIINACLLHSNMATFAEAGVSIENE